MLNHTVLDYNGKHTEKNGERLCGSTSESSMEAGGEKAAPKTTIRIPRAVGGVSRGEGHKGMANLPKSSFLIKGGPQPPFLSSGSQCCV